MVVLDQDTSKMINYRQLLQHLDPEVGKAWTKSAANEYRQLANGVGSSVKGTKAIKFIQKQDLHKNRQEDVTYGQLVCTERNKKDKN